MVSNDFNITAKQALERMTTFDRISDKISRIVREELDLPDGGLVNFYHVPISLGYRGRPFRPRPAFESQWQKPLIVPNITIYMEKEPRDPNILKNCVETLRHGRSYGAEWEEPHGDPPLSSTAAQKFSVELSCADWATWFPPACVELPCREVGTIFEHRVDDKADFRRWEAHISMGCPLVEAKHNGDEKTRKAPGHLTKTVVFETETVND
ncbi:hypothetical protein F5Y19DRAFT_479246 [Xylariaceae sp. FL1651]|nr:hypothetical protein F5Y19DRAFT_479246 [Xylariaceae sp. FL1651]